MRQVYELKLQTGELFEDINLLEEEDVLQLKGFLAFNVGEKYNFNGYSNCIKYVGIHNISEITFPGYEMGYMGDTWTIKEDAQKEEIS